MKCLPEVSNSRQQLIDALNNNTKIVIETGTMIKGEIEEYIGKRTTQDLANKVSELRDGGRKWVRVCIYVKRNLLPGVDCLECLDFTPRNHRIASREV
jgi:hypothetical protein